MVPTFSELLVLFRSWDTCAWSYRRAMRAQCSKHPTDSNRLGRSPAATLWVHSAS
jgi:hypothetical protein